LCPLAPHGHSVLIQPMHPQTVGLRLRAVLRRAGVVHCSPHDWRRTFATRLVEAGAASDMVSKELMGHANPATLHQHYLRRNREQALDAATQLLPPLPK